MKNHDVQHQHLQHGMDEWARNNIVELDRGIFFESNTLDNIAALCFSPGQGVAQFQSAEQGLSLLICWTHTHNKIERIRK